MGGVRQSLSKQNTGFFYLAVKDPWGVRQQPPRFLHLTVLITRKKTALEQALAVFISSAKICDFRKRGGCCRDDWI